ncbi:MAG: methyltransferase [Pseudomonadota bacterium]
MKFLFSALAAASVVALAGCTTAPVESEAPSLSVEQTSALDAVLAAQPEDAQTRYDARNPAETLAFFGIEPGMTVVEVLPGGGWYSKILIPYLGPEGQLIAAHYPDEIWPALFGEDADPERINAVIARADGWAAGAREWYGEDGADIQQYKMTDGQAAENPSSVDAALFVRALHNLHRSEAQLGLFTEAIAETYDLVKPGGVVGVVQHSGPETNSDEWADGNAGYLKQSRLIAAFEAAGFVLEATSDINANPADVPSEDDFVWRLPPSTATSEEGTPERAAFEAIGESNRMTLLFRKPA